MTRERFKEIMNQDNATIWSEDIDKLIEVGITEEDTLKLQTLNWHIEEDYLACFV
jgi:ferritin